MKAIQVAVSALFLQMSVASAADVLPEAVAVCASLLRDSERLACYDRAIAAITAGQAATGVSPENMFGANSGTSQEDPDLQKTRREELKQISATVTSLRRTADGMIVLDLDNGQSWRQQDSDVRMMMATGDQVTIVRASMGTFRIADKTGRFARFKRVR